MTLHTYREGEIAENLVRLVRRYRGYPATALTREVQELMGPSKREVREVLKHLIEDGELAPDWHGNIVEGTNDS